jgi:8-oxo-dGTP pyrophosphatase MutT (NUDIX family)
MAAQDEQELFDLVDEAGRPLGIRKARGLVHRDGDWHRSLHVWVLLARGVVEDGGEDGGASAAEGREPWVLLQRRSAAKDTWPGALDVAVTGHYAAGEQLEDALREAEEEIGLPLTPSDIFRVGVRRRVDDHAPPIVDREVQDVLLAVTPRGLADLRPAPDEISALLALPLGAALALARGEAEAAPALELAAPSAAPIAVTVRLADFVGAPDGYYKYALESIARRLAGEEPAAWTLGP